jgi:hypothetical protein
MLSVFPDHVPTRFGTSAAAAVNAVTSQKAAA